MSQSPTPRIQTARHGKIEPLIPTSPLRSSGRMWQGIILEKHLAGAEYTRTDFDVHSHLVHSFGSVPATSGWRVDGRNHRVQHTPGGVLIEPKGLHASVQVSRARPDVQWIIELEPAGIEESLNGKPFSPTPQLNLRDPQIDRLVEVLQAEVDSGCPSGSVLVKRLVRPWLSTWPSATLRQLHAMTGRWAAYQSCNSSARWSISRLISTLKSTSPSCPTQ